MSRAFTEISFTKSVQAAQRRYGSRDANARLAAGEDAANELGPHESAFIEARDSMFQASVSETGWPYVQHRGGAQGFMRVLNERTIAYADFRGNRQYISVGNLGANDRVCLILVDYAQRQRLKIWGRAKIVELADDPALIDRLRQDNYRAVVERAVLITVEAFSWNCPQHIVPRFTEAEINSFVAPLLAENNALKARILALEAQLSE